MKHNKNNRKYLNLKIKFSNNQFYLNNRCNNLLKTKNNI